MLLSLIKTFEYEYSDINFTLLNMNIGISILCQLRVYINALLVGGNEEVHLMF